MLCRARTPSPTPSVSTPSPTATCPSPTPRRMLSVPMNPPTTTPARSAPAAARRPRFPGIRITTNGNQLVAYHTEARITEGGVFYPITPGRRGRRAGATKPLRSTQRPRCHATRTRTGGSGSSSIGVDATAQFEAVWRSGGLEAHFGESPVTMELPGNNCSCSRVGKPTAGSSILATPPPQGGSMAPKMTRARLRSSERLLSLSLAHAC
jgi:hypothetical protein